MVSDQYQELLLVIGEHFSTELEPDENNTCLLQVDKEIDIHLELDPSQDFFLVGSNIGELPPGKFREDVLKEALIANNKPYPRNGNLAYSRKLNSLVMYEMLEMKYYPNEVLVSIVSSMVTNAKKWKSALAAGQTTPYTDPDEPGTVKGPKMFGL